jgi:hypothetical protein
MEFGKKYALQRKVMKLSYKEGITLKQAWKKVKAGKKAKKPSSKKSKSKNLAKKAMKLMWKDGITLKQAWKKVKAGNKFGAATVCKQGLEYNPWWGEPRLATRPAANRQECIKECVLPRVRNTKTNFCHLPKSAPGEVSEQLPQMSFNSKSALSLAMKYSLGPNDFNPADLRPSQKITVDNVKAVIEARGLVLPKTEKPKKDPKPISCPSDSEINPNAGPGRRKCVKKCKPGLVRAESGRCKKDESNGSGDARFPVTGKFSQVRLNKQLAELINQQQLLQERGVQDGGVSIGGYVPPPFRFGRTGFGRTGFGRTGFGRTSFGKAALCNSCSCKK